MTVLEASGVDETLLECAHADDLALCALAWTDAYGAGSADMQQWAQWLSQWAALHCRLLRVTAHLEAMHPSC